MRMLKNTVVLILFLSIFGTMELSWAQLSQDQRKEVALHYYRGVVNFEAGQYQNAMAEFQAVAAIDPYYKDTQQYLEYCVKMLEQYRQSLLKPEEELTPGKKDFDLYFLGKSYYERGDYNRALEVFKTVLAKNPNDKFAKYYLQLCQNKLGSLPSTQKAALSADEQMANRILDLEKEVSYIKSDIKEQQDIEHFFETKAERKAAREELIRKKERELKEQEELLEEERQDYLAQAEISKRAKRIRQETEKWKNMKMQLASQQPGVPAELSEYPIFLNKAENYFVVMKEALRASRWNSAGLNAIQASLYYCDALLVYFYSVRSAEPSHENICRLLLTHVKRADVDENVSRLRAVLNLKKVVEEEDRPITRSEAIFLVEHAEKLAEWCKTILP